LLTVYILASLVVLFYWIRYYYQLIGVRENTPQTKEQKPLSIIIAAYNESENLRKNLPIILTQDYSNFELIIIDDHSTDNTSLVLENIVSDRIRVLKNDKGKKGKKSAISKGVKESINPYLVFIDADCVPSSKKWLQFINTSFHDNKNLVLGHGRYYCEPGFLNKIIRYESLINAIQYFSFAKIVRPFMGVGRNMAYSKDLYLQSKGFENHLDIIGGDDDLFVNENSEILHVEIMLHESSHTISFSKKKIREYFIQKRRHLQAGTKYKLKDKISLAIFGASQFIFSALFLVLLLSGFHTYWVLLIFIIKQLIQVYGFHDICKNLKDRDLIYWSPILEPIYIFLITIIGISTWVWKVDRWK
jgi:glycosyltransferase involved in cell wall biosynthesis